MRVALVHDWLTGMRGGERCLSAFLDIYPDADIHTLIHIPETTSLEIDSRVCEVSFLNSIPKIDRLYRMLLPLYPFAIRGLRLEGYDLVISLSHAAAKNVRIPKGTRHISYCFTPMRYVWDQTREYFGSLTPVLWPMILLLRSWDRHAYDPRTEFVGISKFIQARIRCFYGKESSVIYPPVDTSWISPITEHKQGEAFLFAGALVPYKRPEVVIEAFNRVGAPLWVVGKGPEESKLRRAAKENITFLGHPSDEELADLYRRCRALVFPGTEDFGMIPVECMSAGRPVVGIYDGGLRESVRGLKPWNGSKMCVSSPTGVFYLKDRAHELDSLISALYYFMDTEDSFNPEFCIAQGKKFSPEAFRLAWCSFVNGEDLPEESVSLSM